MKTSHRIRRLVKVKPQLLTIRQDSCASSVLLMGISCQRKPLLKKHISNWAIYFMDMGLLNDMITKTRNFPNGRAFKRRFGISTSRRVSDLVPAFSPMTSNWCDPCIRSTSFRDDQYFGKPLILNHSPVDQHNLSLFLFDE